MVKKEEGKSPIKRREAQDTTLRCVNCFTRLTIPGKAERATCSKCGVEYMIGWRGKGKKQAKIKGTPIPGKHI